jgi:hypothetical protein
MKDIRLIQARQYTERILRGRLSFSGDLSKYAEKDSLYSRMCGINETSSTASTPEGAMEILREGKSRLEKSAPPIVKFVLNNPNKALYMFVNGSIYPPKR